MTAQCQKKYLVLHGGRVSITGQCAAASFGGSDSWITPARVALCKVCNCSTAYREHLRSGQIKIMFPFQSYKLVLRCQVLFVQSENCAFMLLLRNNTDTAQSKLIPSFFISFKTQSFFISPLTHQVSSVSAVWISCLLLYFPVCCEVWNWQVNSNWQVNHN